MAWTTALKNRPQIRRFDTSHPRIRDIFTHHFHTFLRFETNADQLSYTAVITLPMNMKDYTMERGIPYAWNTTASSTA